ncbi:hypothetical protein [Lactococcus sp. NH2-7C]|uniref:hypothetical protein n=1 Tax=Lactococcus sp. NH2-7C TaxID=2879149 RepID=UPI001CDB9D1C|nr:hypothetical protein [Lactococcus sp. NH2-7C]MCA2391282.1 hypothetical protein [Lactococcus sp. NH2-7C]WGV31333.1 hypothetical protein QJV49_04850 [Lactococcus sp. NH2-7C]
MTIVASNSLTISNVYDGSITHYAYAYSADGTDRFTTVYPQVNLLNGSRTYSKSNPYVLTGNSVDTYTHLRDVTANLKAGNYTLNAQTDGVWVNHLSTTDPSVNGVCLWLVGTENDVNIALGNTVPQTINVPKDGIYCIRVNLYSDGTTNVSRKFWDFKLDSGSNATPYIPSLSEVTSADWPNYIGQYSDFSSTASTDPAKYAPWIIFKGNDGKDGIAGKDGVGIKTTTITYVGSTSGTTVPTSGWTSTIPTVAAGSYLWTKTVWTYTDNSSSTGYSIAKMGNDGAPGSTGAPGKVVSDTEPTTRFKGLTWKYSGTADLTASDGTVILSGTEYYWSGTNWILSEINAHNINGDNLSVTNGTFTDGKIESTWSSSAASGSTEIENSHINMSATDSTSKATNSLGLDVQQGLGMRWSDPTSNQSRSVLLDYGNLSFDRNGVAAGLSFDGTNLSSSMPIQAPNTIVKSTQFTVSGMGIRLDRLMSFVAVTFFGQASSTISNQTINNMLPVGFRPINPYSIDYMIPGHIADNSYIYFNPDGSIAIMTTITSGYYIRGTRLYITNDVYPS